MSVAPTVAGHVAGKHPLLLRGTEAGVQRQQYGIAEIAAFQMMMHVADVALAAQEHQHITGGWWPVATLLLIDFAQHLLHLRPSSRSSAGGR